MSTYARGGNWITIPVGGSSTGAVMFPSTSFSNYERYIWNVSTGSNNCLKITYNIRLGAGDAFTIYSDASQTHILTEKSCMGADDQTFYGEVYTTSADGIACIVLDVMQRPLSELDDYIYFSYQPSPSISCDNLTASGNVGIGTDNPLYKLDVRGTMRANEIRVDIPSGADFVFEDNHLLMPISELSAYVTENHHLPEIMSAEEMKTAGVSVSEFQIQLLQKVEELTLYIIQQQAMIEAFRSQLMNY